MKTLTASDLLTLWERGAGHPPVQQALMILATAFPDQSYDSLADLSIGWRDAALLSLRARTFGDRLACLADCPECAEKVEISFQAGEVLAQVAEPPVDELQAGLDGYHLHFRLPNSHDLLAAASMEAPDARRLLLDGCILAASQAGQPVAPADLPEALLTDLGREMAAADPLAEISFELVCPACTNTWLAPFDILNHFWSEIETWAYRTLDEIHCLARAYGWSESEILDLSAWRRRYYISLL